VARTRMQAVEGAQHKPDHYPEPQLDQSEHDDTAWRSLEAGERISLARADFEFALAAGPEGLEDAARALSLLRAELYPTRQSEYIALERAFDEIEVASTLDEDLQNDD
jgi:hypothetical protein